MPWLKYEICYKHGYAKPEYVEIDPRYDLDDLKNEIKFGPDGDPDGIREPRWEVVEELPLDVLIAKVNEAEHAFESAKNHVIRMRNMLRDRTDLPVLNSEAP